MRTATYLPGDLYAGGVGEARNITASKGLACTTTAQFVPILDGVTGIEFLTRNYAGGAAVVRYALNPYLLVVKTTDNLGSTSNTTDYSKNAQDGDAATLVDLSSLSTLANNDYLLIGSHLPFRGVDVDVNAANGNASVLTVTYWNGSAWTDITATDGTTNGGATFAIDGQVTWTVPAAWTAAQLVDIISPAPVYNSTKYRNEVLYWTRWEVSAALDSSTTLKAMLTMNRSTTYAEMISTFARDFRVYKAPGGLGCIEALTDAGTANLIINGFTRLGESGIG